MVELIKPDEYTSPPDLKNFGVKCIDCGSSRVVYQITVPAPGFPCGTYCFKCLVNHCRQSSRIPMPIAEDLAQRLEIALGINRHTPGKRYYFVPELPKTTPPFYDNKNMYPGKKK